jgi:superfamily II RNA helicase
MKDRASRKDGGHRFYGRRRTAVSKRRVSRLKPEADARLRTVFAKIGTPPKEPFMPDRFQLEAVDAIGTSDCLVCAPTGSGKTWIAQEAIRRVFERGGKSWYASPLKALTNSKLLEFGEAFGVEQVGILTGDRKENADAPIIVGTTEILRNQLYDAMHQGADLKTDLVVLDEAHFLGDEDRGVVWEETMIYLPQRVPLLLLSATVGNAHQIADWLETIRSKPCAVIEEKGRPVPLVPLFFHPTGRLLPLLGKKGLDKKVRHYLRSPNPPVLAAPRQLPPFSDVLRVFRKFDLLPAIFFMKSRADCDAALERCIEGHRPKADPNMVLNRRINELTEGQSHLSRHRQMKHLRQAAVAAHHSGQLPAWKLVIENLMTHGLLDAVFATSTVAAGVNFPARIVVFLNSDRYNGHAFVPLDGTEFHQTTGRAGRRGKDRIGFAIVIPGKYMDVRLMADLCTAPPEDVISQIKVNFSMVLNLLLSYTPEQIEKIFQRSFATYLNLSNQQPGLNQSLKDNGHRLMAFLPNALCGKPELALDLIRQRRATIRELGGLRRNLKTRASRLSKLAHLETGRLFLDRRNRLYCVIQSKMKGEERGVLACRVKGRRPPRAKRIRTRWFAPQKVSQLLDEVLELPPSDHPQEIGRLLIQTARRPFPQPLESLPLGKEEIFELRPLENRSRFLEAELERSVCKSCGHFQICHGKTRGAFRKVLEDFTLQWNGAYAERMRLWNDFVKHLTFLKEEGFVTETNRLTDDGLWASKLRLDLPLMIAEGLRKGVFPDASPVLLAALVAPFVHDRDSEVMLDDSRVPKDFLRSFENMKKALTPLLERKTERGFDVRPITIWPGAVVYAWGKGLSWEKVVKMTGISEGDLSMLVLRTAESLRQIASLTKNYPATAKCAWKAIEQILREPVVVPH